MTGQANLIKVLSGHTEDRIWHLSWSHDGQYLATCGEDKIIRIWSNVNSPGNWEDVDGIKCICTLEDAQYRTLRSCEWSIDGNNIVSTSFDGITIVWECLQRDKRVWEQVASLEGHDNEVKSVSWSYDGKLLATCGRDKKIWIWEKLDSGEFESIAVLEGHTQDIKFIKFHHAMNVLLSCSYDDTIKIWIEDDDDWYCNKTLIGHSSTVWCLSIDQSHPRIVSGCDDGSTIVWECDNLEFEGEWRVLEKTPKLHDFAVYSIDWNHDHGMILSGGGDNKIVISDSQLNDCTSIPLAHANDVNCVRWNPHKSHQNVFASCGDDGLVKIWKFEM